MTSPSPRLLRHVTCVGSRDIMRAARLPPVIPDRAGRARFSRSVSFRTEPYTYTAGDFLRWWPHDAYRQSCAFPTLNVRMTHEQETPLAGTRRQLPRGRFGARCRWHDHL